MKRIFLFGCLLLAGVSFANPNPPSSVVALTPGIADMLVEAGVNNVHRVQPILRGGAMPAPARGGVNGETIIGHRDFLEKGENAELARSEKFYDIPYKPLNNIPDQIIELGNKFGTPSVAAENAGKLREVLNKYPARESEIPMVIIVGESNGKYIVAGRGTYVAEVWERSGGLNVVERQRWPSFTEEEIANLKPKLLVVASGFKAPDISGAQMYQIKHADGFIAYGPGLIERGLPEAAAVLESMKKS